VRADAARESSLGRLGTSDDLMAAPSPDAPDYAIIATEASADEGTHVLKAGDTFAVLDRHGDVHPGGLGQLGLYVEGTRRLSRLELGIGGHRPLLLSSTVTEDNSASIVDLTNPDVAAGREHVLRRETLHLQRSTVVTEGALHSQISIQNYGLETAALEIDLLLAADFADVFEVRGKRRPARGETATPVTRGRSLRFAYRGLDDELRATLVTFDPAPELLTASRATWRVEIAAGAEAMLTMVVGCSPDVDATAPFAEVRARSSEMLRERAAPLARILTSHEQLGACFHRAAADLAIMLHRTPCGLYPHAGVPWFCTPFGRDGIVTAYELLWLHPPVAEGVLRFLASTQATTTDPSRDAEPGKILHEARDGEMANLGEIPFGRYYGSVDATPLFVFLAGAYYDRTGDRALVETLWPHVTAALDWIDGPGDADGDGFVEYARMSSHGLRQQGWKDSDDSVFDETGRLVDGPIALAEVQAYVYGAKRMAAGLADLVGESERGRRLRDEAETLRLRFDDAFWCEDVGTYALALDGSKRPCRVRSSNAGHCLLTGIAREDRASRVAASLLDADLFSGWGVRTLGTRERRFNPLSYHNGTVWPHDNAMIAAGLARYGHTDHAVPIFEGLLEASRWMTLDRLPELFCGFQRRQGQGPTLYPVACAPQAWAAGAPYSLLASVLGLEISAPERRVVLRRPRLPAGLDRVTIPGLRVGDAAVDLDIRRAGATVRVDAHTIGDVEVRTLD
jgi:glycogen debranching enzyme